MHGSSPSIAADFCKHNVLRAVVAIAIPPAEHLNQMSNTSTIRLQPNVEHLNQMVQAEHSCSQIRVCA
jgi:hypothetical protein